MMTVNKCKWYHGGGQNSELSYKMCSKGSAIK